MSGVDVVGTFTFEGTGDSVGERVGAGVGEGVGLGVGMGIGLKTLKLQLVHSGRVAVADVHVGFVIIFVSNVMAALQSRRPSILAPEFMVIDTYARTVPIKTVFCLSVTELPATQNTLQACVPFDNTTSLEVSAVMVDAAIMRKTASGSP